MNILSSQLHYRTNTDGWNSEFVHVENKIIQYEIHQSFYDCNEENSEEFLIDSIKQNLYDQLIASNSVIISKHEQFENMTATYRGEINVLSNGDQYTGLIETNIFKVENEKFSEKDLIQAVRKTFPERFI
jgi:hypothetical protein